MLRDIEYQQEWLGHYEAENTEVRGDVDVSQGPAYCDGGAGESGYERKVFFFVLCRGFVIDG